MCLDRRDLLDNVGCIYVGCWRTFYLLCVSSSRAFTSLLALSFPRSPLRINPARPRLQLNNLPLVLLPELAAGLRAPRLRSLQLCTPSLSKWTLPAPDVDDNLMAVWKRVDGLLILELVVLLSSPACISNP